MTQQEILDALNPQQGEAASTISGAVLVLAGAGTGKTRVITYRIAYMLASGIPGASILGMTFTNKAAREMRERLAALVGEENAKEVTLGTFHSFCGKILRREIQKLGYLPGYTIADETDQQGIFKQACGKLGCNYEGFPSTEAFSRISKWKNQLVLPREAHRQAETPFDSTAAQIYEEYQAILEEQNQVDFDDMLLLVWRLFAEFPEVLAACRERYRYLLVDEYQDTNYAQYTILKMLGGDHPNLCVVGDDDQSIYSWRGADVGNILDFPEDFPGAKVIKLEQNYRSCSAILNAANMAIASGGARRHRKQLWSALGEGEIPRIVQLDDAEAEAKFICEMVRQIRSKTDRPCYSDFAVLYRSNVLSRQIEQTFRAENIPYRMFGGQPFFQRQEIKDAIAYLRLIVNPNDDQSLLRILSTPPRGLGGKVVELLKNRRSVEHKSMLSGFSDAAFLGKLSHAAQNSATALASVIRQATASFATPGDLAVKSAEYLENVGYFGGLQRVYKDIDDSRKRRENVDEFISAIAQYEARQTEKLTLADYLDSCLLLEEKDRDSEEGGDAVTLSTVHAAKGLEFPVVFVVAMETGLFPHDRAVEEGSIDEERRLFYVAITRAKRALYLLRTARRMNRGVTRPSRPSPFLALLGNTAERKESDELIEKASEEDLRAAFAKIYESLMQGKTE